MQYEVADSNEMGLIPYWVSKFASASASYSQTQTQISSLNVNAPLLDELFYSYHVFYVCLFWIYHSNQTMFSMPAKYPSVIDPSICPLNGKIVFTSIIWSISSCSALSFSILSVCLSVHSSLLNLFIIQHQRAPPKGPDSFILNFTKPRCVRSWRPNPAPPSPHEAGPPREILDPPLSQLWLVFWPGRFHLGWWKHSEN